MLFVFFFGLGWLGLAWVGLGRVGLGFLFISFLFFSFLFFLEDFKKQQQQQKGIALACYFKTLSDFSRKPKHSRIVGLNIEYTTY